MKTRLATLLTSGIIVAVIAIAPAPKAGVAFAAQEQTETSTAQTQTTEATTAQTEASTAQAQTTEVTTAQTEASAAQAQTTETTTAQTEQTQAAETQQTEAQAAEPVKAPTPEEELAAARHALQNDPNHVHKFKWIAKMNESESAEGTINYMCSECDKVWYFRPIEPYHAFQGDVARRIEVAPQGATVRVKTSMFINFNKQVMEAQAARPDVSVYVSFLDQEYKGNRVSFVIPAGEDTMALLDSNGYAGFLFLGGKYGLKLEQAMTVEEPSQDGEASTTDAAAVTEDESSTDKTESDKDSTKTDSETKSDSSSETKSETETKTKTETETVTKTETTSEPVNTSNNK